MPEKNRINRIRPKSEYTFIKPFIYKKASITNISIKMLILLFIQIILLFFTKSYNAIFVISSTFIGSILAFLLRFFVFNEPFYYLFEISLQGLMIGMLLPETYPPIAAMFISLILLVVVKCIFTNVYNVWTNIVALGVVIAWFIGKRFFPSFSLTTELISIKNPSLSLIQKGVFPINSFDGVITSFFNKYVFKIFGVSIPNGYVSLLWDTHSVIPAFRFNIVTLISSLFLFSDDSVETFIPTIFVLVYAVLVKLFAPIFFSGSFNSGDVILAVFSSGILFCSVFILQWFGTIPCSRSGKLIYAISTGVLAFFIIGAGTSSVGMVYTILISNIFSVVIKVVEDKKNLSSLKKAISENEGVYAI